MTPSHLCSLCRLRLRSCCCAPQIHPLMMAAEDGTVSTVPNRLVSRPSAARRSVPGLLRHRQRSFKLDPEICIPPRLRSHLRRTDSCDPSAALQLSRHHLTSARSLSAEARLRFLLRRALCCNAPHPFCFSARRSIYFASPRARSRCRLHTCPRELLVFL